MEASQTVKEKEDQQRALAVAQTVFATLRSAGATLKLKPKLVTIRDDEHDGWFIEFGKLPNGVSVGLSFDRSLWEPTRNLWFGFSSKEKGKLRYLESILPSEFLPALQVGGWRSSVAPSSH